MDKERQFYNLWDKKLNAINESLKAVLSETQKIELKGAEIIKIKGKDGEKGDQGIPGSQGAPGREGRAPTKEEIDNSVCSFIPNLQKRLTDNLKPFLKQGEKGDPGKDGNDGLPGTNGNDGNDGSPDTAEQIIKKILTVKKAWLPVEAIIGRIESQIIRQFGGGNGTGITEVIHDATLTGKGTVEDPLKVAVAGGGLTKLFATGVIDDSNIIFSFIEKPIIIYVNGLAYIESDGWTWAAPNATLDFPIGSSGKIFAVK